MHMRHTNTLHGIRIAIFQQFAPLTDTPILYIEKNEGSNPTGYYRMGTK